MNAGGFSHNQDLRDKYQPGTSSKWTMTAEGDTGEMILEMMRHGAAIAQMEEMVGNQISLAPGGVGGPSLAPGKALKSNHGAISRA